MIGRLFCQRFTVPGRFLDGCGFLLNKTIIGIFLGCRNAALFIVDHVVPVPVSSCGHFLIQKNHYDMKKDGGFHFVLDEFENHLSLLRKNGDFQFQYCTKMATSIQTIASVSLHRHVYVERQNITK